MVLPDGGGLEMDAPAFLGRVITDALSLGGEPDAQSAGDQKNEWTVHEHVSSLSNNRCGGSISFIDGCHRQSGAGYP